MLFRIEWSTIHSLFTEQILNKLDCREPLKILMSLRSFVLLIDPLTNSRARMDNIKVKTRSLLKVGFEVLKVLVWTQVQLRQDSVGFPI
jgi:hypothetical protein